jgi:hypothetical protein
MEILKLIGVLIVIIGFVMKFDTLATVVLAGIATGLVSGLNFVEILGILGNAFLGNRLATLFVLTLPVIGICERYGLKDKAVDFIKGIKEVTAGRIISLYMLIRSLSAAFSLRVGGHPQFIRPIIDPMANAAAVARYGKVDDKLEDEIKGLSASAENFGNFFAQNCFMGSSGTLLIVSTLNEQGFDKVDALKIAMWSIPVAVCAVVISTIYFVLSDVKFDKKYGKGGKK